MKAVRQLDEVDKRIIHLLKNGFTYKEISSEVYKSVDTINYRIRAMKDHFQVKSTIQLISIVEDLK